MSDTNVSELAAAIANQFDTAGIDIDASEDDIASHLRHLVGEYSLPADEARRSVESNLLDATDHDRTDLYADAGSDPTPVDEIDDADGWYDVEVEVLELWDPTHESIAQVGLLGDESGTIKFTAWEASDLPPLVEGETYALDNVVSDEYEGRHSVKLVSTTEITRLENTTIEVSDDEDVRRGAIVEINDGSGLIKRCPDDDCTRTLQNGRCADHGDVDGSFDLRIKAVLDDGDEPQDVLFDADATEALTGISLDDAIEMAKDALDTAVVGEQFETDLIGQYIEVRGGQYGRYLIVEDSARIATDDSVTSDHDAEELLIEARAMAGEQPIAG